MTGWATELAEGDTIVATAIHAGHGMRDELADVLAIEEADRLREEDPHTDRWTIVAGNRIVVETSRFEVDLNRPRERALYLTPDDAWGLTVWKSALADDVVARSLQAYDRFFVELGEMCDSLVERHGRFVLFDLHSYNHRRGGPEAAVDDPDDNPEINVGTGSLDAGDWGSVVTAFMETLAAQPFDGGHLDVRENVRFSGGHMSQWVNERYGSTGCALAIEMKKIFMDEWAGHPDEAAIVSIGEALSVGVDAVRDLLRP